MPAPSDDTPAVAATAPADEPAPAAEVETETAIAEPELDVTPPAETEEVPEDLIAATFGLLRAEPDGSLVIAGSGTPGSEVEVYADGELLGSTTVEPSGDWVLVPEEPIAPGGTEITLAEAGKEGRAEQSFVVVIDPNKTDQPLVVASTPGEASKILQGLETPEAGEEMEVASADIPAATDAATQPQIPATEAPAAQPGAEPVGAAEDAVQPEQPRLAETEAVVTEDAMESADATETAAVAEPAVPVESLTAVEEAQTDAAEIAASEPQSAEIAVEEEPAEPVVAESAPVAEPQPAEDEPTPAESVAVARVPEPADAPVDDAAADSSVSESSAAQTGETAESAPAASVTEPADDPAPAETQTVPADTQTAVVDPQETVEPEPAEPAVALPDVPPTIDAIEIDGDRSFFAGGGPNGAIVRLYVDGTYVADAVVEAGRWLIEAGSILTGPQHRVRIDVLAPGSADVVARAEVNFVVDLPETEPPVAVASATEAEAVVEGQGTPAEADAPAADPEPAAEPESEEAAMPAMAEANEPSAATQPAAPEASQDSAVAAAEAPEPAEEPVQVADIPVEPEAPAEPSAPAETTVAEQPAAEPDATAIAEAPETDATAEPTAEPDVSVTESNPAVEPEAPPTVAEAPSDGEIPTLVAVPVGDPEAERFASGRAIIRRGDNLWTIARRVYGEGIKYTTIYEANADQIRDPDRIYPGQVFDLPEQAL